MPREFFTADVVTRLPYRETRVEWVGARPSRVVDGHPTLTVTGEPTVRLSILFSFLLVWADGRGPGPRWAEHHGVPRAGDRPMNVLDDEGKEGKVKGGAT